ncbi:uncharacterized protein LOC117175616 [Belonocnema kinseyi]|uniref:uncharacterized protein LOC117175616 n=1 Tax=Belonocnema kinseyi TaxID=2817044 RepID=UPI00143DDBEB|nr:uncharacterized protein LOC117175616 [Belonocnema kinseyi]
MAPLKDGLSNSSKRIRFVFYDLETRQTKTLPGDNSVHIHEPNLCVVQKVCSDCLLNENMNNSCKYCGVRQLVFRGDELIENFIEHVTHERKQLSQTICIAHNAKGSDLQFILRYLVEGKGTRIRPKVILNGTKIMLMQVGECKFVDSLNYMPRPLSALPKEFGLTGEHSKKGTFPHFFNRPDNDLYVGPLPLFEDYSPDTMSIEARKEFYDVTILRRACLAYRTIFSKCGNVCPFTESTTIASACSGIYRKNFLLPEITGIIPNGGDRRANKKSVKAIEWLLWVGREIGVETQHAARSRELRLPEGALVDGYYIDGDEKRHVLQFHGCFWHGCVDCYKLNRDEKLKSGDTIDMCYENTRATSEKIRKAGYVLTEIWKCKYDKLKKIPPV